MPHPSHAGSHAESDGQAPFSPLSPFPNFTSPIPLPPPFPVSLDSQSLPLTSPLPINHPSHNEASLPLWSPLAPSPIPQVIGGAFNALLTDEDSSDDDEDSSDDDDDGPALTPTESPILPDDFFSIRSPPAKALAIFPRQVRQVRLSCPPLPLPPLNQTPNPPPKRVRTPQEGDGGGGRERPRVPLGPTRSNHRPLRRGLVAPHSS